MNAIPSLPRLRTFVETINQPLRMPGGVTSRSIREDGIRVEWVEGPHASSESVVMYVHGGAWVLGWYKNHRVLAAHIGRSSGCRVLAVDYRLAPEDPFPASLHDCLAAYEWLLKNGFEPNRIVIAGDSAGANLALAVLQTLRDAGETLPAAVVCISPMTDLACTGDTFHTDKDALLTAEFALSMSSQYTGGRDARLPLISPQYGDMTGLPPMLIHAGEDEILLSDARRLAEKARKAGVDVTLKVWPGMWHVWHIFVPFLPEAVDAVAEIGGFIRRHADRTTEGD